VKGGYLLKKMIFKKISAIVTSALLVGMTAGFAAAASFPAPFSGAQAAIVVGTGVGVAQTDTTAATNIQAKVGTTAAGTIGGEGDKVKLDRASDKINLGDEIATAWGTSLTKTNLPTLLADGTFNNKQNTEYKYNQKFDIGNLSFTHFSDSDLNNRVPTTGFKISSNTNVANYTLTFVTNPESAQTSGNLDDFENRNINIMGKNYYILDFTNSSATNGKLTLLDSATSATIIEGETKTVTMGGSSYEVAINFISTDEVILTVNGVNTEKLSATGTTYGNTYKLSDGTYVGIKSVNVQNYAGGTKNVEFSIGKGKLEVKGDAGSVKINDKVIDDLYGYFTFGSNGAKVNWQKMIIKWQVSDKAFLTPGKELEMPGFSAIKFINADPTISVKEMTRVDYGSTDYWQLKTVLKDGSATIPILYMNAATGNITGVGQSATQQLITTSGTVLEYNATSGTPQAEGFVASWASTKDSESYYLKATVRNDSDGSRCLTTIKNKVTGDTLCEDIASAGTCTIGNVVLTVDSIKCSNAIGEKTVNFSSSANTFNRLYTASGLRVYLPYEVGKRGSDSTLGSPGALNATLANGTLLSLGATSWKLQLVEADKDGTLAKGKWINVTLQSGGSGSSYYATEGTTIDGGDTPLETSSGSKMWESYVYGDLGTKLTQDRGNTNQYLTDLEYHGQEMYANVYVAAPSVTSTTSSAVVVKDSEVIAGSANAEMNLIVVGGSCINSVAAKLLGSTTPICGADFTTSTGINAGEAIIKTYTSPYTATKIATLVAGYNAEDTTNAANALITKTIDTTANKAYKVVTATNAVSDLASA